MLTLVEFLEKFKGYSFELEDVNHHKVAMDSVGYLDIVNAEKNSYFGKLADKWVYEVHFDEELLIIEE